MHEWNLSMRSWASEGQKTSNHLLYDRRMKATRVLTCIKKWLTTSLKWVRTLSTCARWVHAMDKGKTSAQEANVIRSAQCEYTQWTKKRSALKKRMTFCHSKSARQKAQKNKEVSLRNASNKEVSLRNASLLNDANEGWEASGRPSLQVLHDKRPWLNLSPFCFALVAASRAFLISIVSLPLRDVQRVNAPLFCCSLSHWARLI